MDRLEEPSEHVKRLQRSMSHLLSLMALPAIWVGGDGSHVVATLLEALLGMLRVDFVYVLLNNSRGGTDEMVRLAQSLGEVLSPGDIGQGLAASLGGVMLRWPRAGRLCLGTNEFSIASAPIGLQSEIGIIVAGSKRRDFADETERLLLGVAANQAALALQEARLLDAQIRVASDLDLRVAQRTTELAEANRALQREVAERQRTEQALRESEEQSRLIVDSVPAGIVTFESSGEIAGANRQLLDYFGAPIEHVRQWATNDLGHPDDLPGVMKAFWGMIATGEAGSFITRLRRADGVYRWFEVRNVPLRNGDGDIVRWYGVLTDIDDRKHAEDAVAASERDLRLTLESIPAGIIVVSPETGIIDANKQLLGYLGLSLEILKRWTTTNMVHPDDFESTLTYFRTFMGIGRESQHETRIRRFDGVYRWFQVRNNPLRDSDGRVVRWYGLLTDIDDQKRAEEALRDSESQLRLVVNTTPGLIATFTPGGATDDVNEQFLAYLGQTLEEFARWPTNGTVHPADVDRHVEVLTRSFESGRPIDTETRLRRFDGAYRWFQVRGLPARDIDGHILRWYCLMTDIDDRKLAEDAVAASQRNLQITVDTIPALVWSARADGTADFFNRHYLQYVGQSLDELKDWAWTSAVHPDDMPRLAIAWQKARETNDSAECEARLRADDGKYRWFIFRANPLRDETGKVVKWFGINTDIEDRKVAEEALRRSEASLADAQRLVSIGSFTWLPEHDEIAFSAELYRIFEFDRQASVSLADIMARIDPNDVPMLMEQMKLARADADSRDYDLRLRMPDGRTKYLRVISRAGARADGTKVFLGTVQDVSRSRLAEDAANELRSELAHVSRVSTLSAMTASIAHEVNQPLSGIITNASTSLRMLASDPPNIEGARDTARRTIRDGNRAAEVVSRLRALYSKRSEISDCVNLNEAARDVVALSAGELRRNRASLEFELADDLPLVTGDRIQLQQVILNLLLNASDALSSIEERPRQIILRTKQDEDGNVRLIVQDNGVGIEPESETKLFDAFYTTKATGMGIGLSVSRSIIEHHGGRIWASSNGGPGASFVFAIPRAVQRTTETDTAIYEARVTQARAEGSPDA